MPARCLPYLAYIAYDPTTYRQFGIFVLGSAAPQEMLKRATDFRGRILPCSTLLISMPARLRASVCHTPYRSAFTAGGKLVRPFADTRTGVLQPLHLPRRLCERCNRNSREKADFPCPPFVHIDRS